MKRIAGFLSGDKKKKDKQGESVDAKDVKMKENVTAEDSVVVKENVLENKTQSQAQYIKLMGFPSETIEKNVLDFLADCKTIGRVVFIKNDEGSNDAVVKLEDESELKKALSLDKTYDGNRYIRVEKTESKIYEDELDMAVDTQDGKVGGFVKLGGLDWSASEEDIKKFLTGCNVTEVIIEQNERGKPSGNAFVCLATNDDLVKALACHKKHLGKRWVAVEKMEEDEFITKTGKEPQNKRSEKVEKKPENCFVRLGGLSWKATEEDIKTFLKDCKIKKVFITLNERGKPSGNAFIHFEEEEDVRKARNYNKKDLLGRWVTVDAITQEEFQKETQEPDEWFIKLDGLPWEAKERDIKSFLDGCKVEELVITKNERGKPSGNAFFKLESRTDVEKAKSYNKKNLGNRYVTVDVVSEEEFKREIASNERRLASAENF